MKKMLVILGSLGILGSSIMTVVSCGASIVASNDNLIGLPEKSSLKTVDTGHVELEQAELSNIYNDISTKIQTLIQKDNSTLNAQRHIDYEIYDAYTLKPIVDLPTAPTTFLIQATNDSKLLKDSFNYVLWKDINFEFEDLTEFPVMGSPELGNEVLGKIEQVLKTYFPNRNPKDFYWILHDRDNWLVESKPDSELKFSFTYNRPAVVDINGLEPKPFNIDYATKEEIEAEVQRLVDTRVNNNVITATPILGRDYEIQNLVYDESTEKPAHAGIATVVKDPNSPVVEGSFDLHLTKVLPLDLQTLGTEAEAEEVLKQIHQEFKKWNNGVEPVKGKDYEIILENHGWTIRSLPESTIQLKDASGLNDFHFTIIDAIDITELGTGFNLDLDQDGKNGQLLTIDDIEQAISNKIAIVVPEAKLNTDYEIDYSKINFNNGVPQNVGQVIVTTLPKGYLTGSFKVGLTKTVDLTKLPETGWASEWDKVKVDLDAEIKKWLKVDEDVNDYYSIFKDESKIIVSSKDQSLLIIKGNNPEGYIYTFIKPFNLDEVVDLNIMINQDTKRSDVETKINNYLQAEIKKTTLTFPDPSLDYYNVGLTPINEGYGNLYVGDVTVSAKEQSSEFFVGSFKVHLKTNLTLPLDNNSIIETDEEWNHQKGLIETLISQWDVQAANNNFSNYIIEANEHGWTVKSKEDAYVIFDYAYQSTAKTDLAIINSPQENEIEFTNSKGFSQAELELKIKALIQAKVDADSNNNNINKTIDPKRDYVIDTIPYADGVIKKAMNFKVTAKSTSPLIVGTVEVRLIKTFDWNASFYAKNNYLKLWIGNAKAFPEKQARPIINSWSLPTEQDKNYKIIYSLENNKIVLEPVENSNIRFKTFTFEIYTELMDEIGTQEINIDDNIKTTKNGVNAQILAWINTVSQKYISGYDLVDDPGAGPASSHYHFEGLNFVNDKIIETGSLKVIANENDEYLKGSFTINFVKTLQFKNESPSNLFPTTGTYNKGLEVIENINKEVKKWIPILSEPKDYYVLEWNDDNTSYTITSTNPYLKFSFKYTVAK